MKCQFCDGKGGWSEDMGEGTIITDDCPQCNATGRISIFKFINNWLWENLPVFIIELLDDWFN
jgi:hypothetical protein